MVNIEDKLTDHMNLTKEHFDNNFFYIGLYGSQNYGLASEQSDVDTKCIVIPTDKEVILGKKQVNCELTDPSDNSICTVKDIRSMFDNFYKGNINFTEILFTDYFRYNLFFDTEVIKLRNNRELIAKRDIYNLIKMAQGMAKQKFIAFDKPFESKIPLIEKYGYDPKQLHHIVRLFYFIADILDGSTFEEALKQPKEIRDYLMQLKLDPSPYTLANQLKHHFMSEIDKMVEEYEYYHKDTTKTNDRDLEVRELLDNIAYDVISKSMHIS